MKKGGSMNNINVVEEFATSLSLEQVPVDVLEKSKLLILDSLSAMVKGNQSVEVNKLINVIANNQQSDGECDQGIILGETNRCDSRMAALINGIGMVADELDEGNPLAKGHPAAHFMPSLLSTAFKHHVSGAKLLEGFIVNYEISARLGSVIKLKDSIHPHGNWGVFGNGFGIGKLLDWKDGSKYTQAAMLGVSFSMPTLWQSVLEGHNVRNVTIGLNNFHTTLLSDLGRAGFTASLSTLETIYKDILADQYHGLPDDLFGTYYLLESYFKFYPYCRFCHSPVDAVIELIDEDGPNNIKRIRVITYGAAAKLNAQKVANEFAGKFSIPYAIAAELYEVYYSESVINLNKDDMIQKLMELVTVTESKAHTELLPNKRVTTVEIELIDGSIKERTVERATGDPDEWLLKEKVIYKSKAILCSRFELNRVHHIIDMVLNIEKLEDITELKRLLILS